MELPIVSIVPCVIKAWECCCGLEGHRQPEQKGWQATSSDWPGIAASSTTIERAVSALREAIAHSVKYGLPR